MPRSFILSSALLALRVAAQTSSQFTDENTGITFSGYQHISGYRFGIALPENPTTDYIAQVQAPITNDGGWAGFSMVSHHGFAQQIPLVYSTDMTLGVRNFYARTACETYTDFVHQR
jgi:hypothetical protein